MADSAQAEESSRERSRSQHHRVDRPLPARAERDRRDGHRQQDVRDPGRRAQRIVESVLQRLVQLVRGYFPLVAKYISISPSRITKATAAAIGP